MSHNTFYDFIILPNLLFKPVILLVMYVCDEPYIH